MHGMAAPNPRITISLRPTTAAVLKRMSTLTGNSQSGIVADLLEANEPVFDRLLQVLQAAHDAKAAYLGETKRGLEEAQSQIERQLGLALGAFEDATSPLLEQAERIARRSAKRASGGAPLAGIPDAVLAASDQVPTPLSNRGVRSGNKSALTRLSERGNSKLARGNQMLRQPPGKRVEKRGEKRGVKRGRDGTV